MVFRRRELAENAVTLVELLARDCYSQSIATHNDTIYHP